MRIRSRRAAGFTLIEAVIVVGVIAILAALAGLGLIYGTQRARVNNAAFSLGALTAVAQMRAASTGHSQYLVVYQSSTGAAGALVIHREDLTNPDWGVVDLSTDISDLSKWQTKGIGQVIEHFALTGGGFSFRTLDGLATLPVPYGSISLTKSGTSSDLMKACTFCRDVTGGTLGALRYRPEGIVTDSINARLSGAALAIATATSAEQPNIKVLAVTIPAGITKIIDRN